QPSCLHHATPSPSRRMSRLVMRRDPRPGVQSVSQRCATAWKCSRSVRFWGELGVICYDALVKVDVIPRSLMNPGAILAERYRIVELLRRECFGSFFLAVDQRTEATVAVKIYEAGQDERGREGDVPPFRTRFQREVNVLVRIKSRYIPKP